MAESVAGKLDAAMSIADDQDAAKGWAIMAINQTVTDFRATIREDEPALRAEDERYRELHAGTQRGRLGCRLAE